MAWGCTNVSVPSIPSSPPHPGCPSCHPFAVPTLPVSHLQGQAQCCAPSGSWRSTWPSSPSTARPATHAGEQSWDSCWHVGGILGSSRSRWTAPGALGLFLPSPRGSPCRSLDRGAGAWGPALLLHPQCRKIAFDDEFSLGN